MQTQIPPIALVTGAASGMGKAVADRMLAEGWQVIALDIVPCPPQPGLQSVQADICNLEQLEEGVRGALAGRTLQAAVNAAGIFPVSSLETYSEALYRRIFDVNVLGTLNIARVAAENMSPAGGALLFFASVDAFAVSQNQLIYSASKAAVVSLAKSLALELVDRGIVVNAIAPGWVETEGTRRGGRLEEGVKAVPMKRAASLTEIADWVWMLSHRPSYITGETLVISGGVYMR
ncbi:short-chain dehydrogenase [Izhakiella australiensis]|uniref:Short-chain dehydrogenase n=1 Tax=Izhakiella australiensis TaxID=1926881 RepID=A0A1S8YRJ6_9GAMM|nr:SDR family oxidoreductase [Izhakiella australiensis]OON41670.1 short-chain dehydrogenase [Izhakiella australiensis]